MAVFLWATNNYLTNKSSKT